MNDLDPGAQLTRRLVRVVLPLAVLLFGLPLAAHLYIELRWYRSLGHSELYMTMLTTKLGLGLTVLVLVGLALLLNLRIASRFSQSLAPLYLYDREGIPQINLSEALLRLALPACFAGDYAFDVIDRTATPPGPAANWLIDRYKAQTAGEA